MRGGGLYACGFAATFLVLEAGSLREDLAQLGGILSGGVVAFIIDFFVDSFTNTMQALVWPVLVVTFSPPWGAIGLGLAYMAFAKYLKPPITRWLFPDGAPEGDE